MVFSITIRQGSYGMGHNLDALAVVSLHERSSKGTRKFHEVHNLRGVKGFVYHDDTAS